MSGNTKVIEELLNLDTFLDTNIRANGKSALEMALISPYGAMNDFDLAR